MIYAALSPAMSFSSCKADALATAAKASAFTAFELLAVPSAELQIASGMIIAETFWLCLCGSMKLKDSIQQKRMTVIRKPLVFITQATSASASVQCSIPLSKAARTLSAFSARRWQPCLLPTCNVTFTQYPVQTVLHWTVRSSLSPSPEGRAAC